MRSSKTRGPRSFLGRGLVGGLLLAALVAALAGMLALGSGPAAGAPVAQMTPISVQPTPTPVRTSTPVVPGGLPGTPVATPVPGQPGAPTGSVSARITYPPDGQIIALQPFLVQFAIDGIKLDASLVGEASAPGIGHWLLLVDGLEVAAGDSGEVSIGGLPPGTHQIALQVRNNDRSPLIPPVGGAIEVCIEVCTSDPIPPVLPDVPGGLPRTGTGGLAGP